VRRRLIDNEMGFQLVPWWLPLEQQLGKQVAGVMSPGGGVDWNFGRKRGLWLCVISPHHCARLLFGFGSLKMI